VATTADLTSATCAHSRHSGRTTPAHPPDSWPSTCAAALIGPTCRDRPSGRRAECFHRSQSVEPSRCWQRSASQQQCGRRIAPTTDAASANTWVDRRGRRCTHRHTIRRVDSELASARRHAYPHQRCDLTRFLTPSRDVAAAGDRSLDASACELGPAIVDGDSARRCRGWARWCGVRSQFDPRTRAHKQSCCHLITECCAGHR
jgi:hypothetical protein